MQQILLERNEERVFMLQVNSFDKKTNYCNAFTSHKHL